MSRRETIEFSHLEVRSCLPGGWCLADPSAPGTWHEKRSRWSILVLDSTEVTWELCVTAGEARQDRMGALKAAIDRLYREALG